MEIDEIVTYELDGLFQDMANDHYMRDLQDCCYHDDVTFSSIP